MGRIEIMIAPLVSVGTRFTFSDRDSIRQFQESAQPTPGYVSECHVFTVVSTESGRITVSHNEKVFSFPDSDVFRIKLNPQTDC